MRSFPLMSCNWTRWIVCTFVAGLLLGPALPASAGEIRKGGSSVGSVESNGDIRIDGSTVGRFDRHGDIRKGGSLAGSVESNGEVRKGGRTVGKILDDGTVRANGKAVGSASGVPKAEAAALFFFEFVDL